MKYKHSSLKHQLNELGVFNIRLLEPINTNYTNDFSLKANQWIGGSEIVHKINALTLEDAMSVLLKRAAAFDNVLKEISAQPYEAPDIEKRNMVGHLNDGNVELVADVFALGEI